MKELTSVREPEFRITAEIIDLEQLDSVNHQGKTFLSFLGVYEDDQSEKYLMFLSQDDKRWYCIKA